MADEQYRQVNGPQGPINFPIHMGDAEVESAMRKLYPPKQMARPVQQLPAPSMAAKIGNYVPEAAMPALETANKYLVQPFERMAAKGAQVGGDIVAGAVKYGTPLTPAIDSPVAQGVARGVGETAGGLVADPRNWPLMGSSSVRPVLQKLITRGFTAMMAKGTYDAASDLYTNWDKMTPAQRSEIGTKAGLSAVMTAGLAAHWSGSTAGSEVVDQGAKLKEQFGKDAKAVPPPSKVMTPEETKARLVDVQARVEPKPPVQPPVKAAEDAIEQTRRRTVEPAATKPPVNQVPEAARASTIIPKEEQAKMAQRIEGRAADKVTLEAAKPMDLAVKEPTVADRVAKIKEVTGVTAKEIKRAPENMAAEDVFARGRQLRAEGLSEPEQVATLMKEYPQHADDIARAFQTKRPEVGGSKPSAEGTKLEAKPVPSAQEAKGPGEPVRVTEKSPLEGDFIEKQKRQAEDLVASQPPAQAPKLQEKVDFSTAPSSEPRYRRGDLGERPPQPPAAKTPALPDKAVFDQRVQEYLKRHPNMAEGTAKRFVAEAMRKERGSVGPGGGSPDRQAKINIYLDMLRDPKTSPQGLDQAYKFLTKIYGFSHDDIISRMAGGAEFAKTPKPPVPEQNVHDLMDTVDKVMERHEATKEPLAGFSAAEIADWDIKQRAKIEGALTGRAEIAGIKRPGDEELERMFNLKDERGFWTMFPSKKPAPPRQGIDALDDLTAKLESSMKAIPPDDSRMKMSERLANIVSKDWDAAQTAIAKLTAHAVSLKDMYMRPPEQTDYSTSVGRFSGSLNRSVWELRQFTKAIKDKLPDQRRREAVTNWIQAGGDDAVLADRAARSKGTLRAGYETARTLTPEEKHLAGFIQNHFERRLEEAIQMDVLKDGLDNYVPQIWKPKDQQSMTNFFSSLHRSGLIKTDFNSAKKRVFESYFEGEQAGRSPVNKDIGFLVASWDKAFNQAIASRTLVRDLSAGLAKDGRPIIAPSGTGKAVYDSGSMSPEVGEKPSAYVIYPKAGPDETGDYRLLDHSALTKWTWATKDADGTPIFMKGDLRVHPEHAQKLDNVINRGKWAQAHPVQTALLKGSGFFKATLLSISPFHQIQEGTHGIFHEVNVFNPKQIDLANPSLGKLLDHGLVLGNFDPAAAFDEGLAAGGLAGKIPGFGQFAQKYSEYLFSDYIPRLKAAMGTAAYDRNLTRFKGALDKGTITTDHIAEITANQANAAFGELNYVTMGRSPQTQALMRFAFLAPDFLEARARFVGQALTPFGREQQAALLRGAIGLYGTSRILNQLLDNDPHWDRPFSLIVHGYEYSLRSLPGDIWHLLSDSNSFMMHRLNPTMVKPLMEIATGKDDFGRKRSVGEQALDFVRGVVPIPLQSQFKTGGEGSLKDRLLTGALSSAGITRSKYRTEAGALAHQYALGSNPNDITSHHISELVQDMTENRLDAKHVRDLILSGKMNPKDLQTAIKMASLPELYRDYYRLPVELKAKVFAKATPNERAILNAYSKKELDTTRLLPEQRAQFMKEFASQ
jgi:hypothetical protein